MSLIAMLIGDPLMNVGRQLPSGRVGELVEILTNLDANGEDDGETVLGNES